MSDHIARGLAGPRSAHRLLVDWANDGDFDAEGDDVSADCLEPEGLTAVRGRDQATALAQPVAGDLAFALDNRDRRYSPYNPDSPLPGPVMPGRRVNLTMDGREGEEEYAADLWAGYLDEPEYLPGLGQRAVRFTALGGLSRLLGVKLSTPLYQDILVDEALGVILDLVEPPGQGLGNCFDEAEFDLGQFAEAGWPQDLRRVGQAATVLAWWWLDDEDALDALLALLASEGPGAALYEGGAGEVVFEGRDYRATAERCTTSQATFRDTPAEGEASYAEIVYRPRLSGVYNRATAEVVLRSPKEQERVWQTDERIVLAAGQSRTFLATADEPFSEAVAPEAGVDYTLNSGSALVWLDRPSGQRATITVGAGPSGCDLTGMALRARPVTEDRTVALESQMEADDSILTYGLQTFEYRGRAEVAQATVQGILDAVVGLYLYPRPQVAVVLEGPWPEGGEQLRQQLTREVSDCVTVVERQTGLNHQVTIERIEQDLHRGWLRTLFGCEQADSSEYALFDLGEFDVGLFGI